MQYPAAISAEYWHQDLVTLNSNPNFGGNVSLSTGWFNATNSVPVLAYPNQGFAFSKWVSNSPSIVLLNTKSQATSITADGTGVVTADFVAAVSSSVSPSSVSVVRGHTLRIVLTVVGYPQTVTLSHNSFAGISWNWKSRIKDNLSGVPVMITITVSSTAHIGSDHFTITAKGVDGQRSSIAFTLKVT